MNENNDLENKKKHKGSENLIPLASRSPEEQFAIRSKGGRNAMQANKKRKTAQEAMQALLSVELDPTKLRERYGEDAELLGENPTLLDALSLAQVREAQEGSTRAFEAVRDTAGYQPTQKVNAEVNTMSDADRALLEKVAKRMQADKEN